MNKIRLWFNIIRPKTLLSSICPILVGGLLAYEKGIKDNGYIFFFLTLLCGVGLQILSNLINDYYDFKKGADKKDRLGPKRALAEGKVSIKQMKTAICIDLALVILLGLVLIWRGGLPILLIGISAIFFAWLYTATSHSLSYLGIADIFVLIYYGLLAVCGTYLITTNNILFTKETIFAGLTCGFISMMLLMINNLRDIDEDREAGKHTLVVRFGKKTGETLLLIYAFLILVCTFAAFGLSITNFAFIPAYGLFTQVIKAKGSEYNKCLTKVGFVNLFFVVLLSIQTFV